MKKVTQNLARAKQNRSTSAQSIAHLQSVLSYEDQTQNQEIQFSCHQFTQLSKNLTSYKSQNQVLDITKWIPIISSVQIQAQLHSWQLPAVEANTHQKAA